MLLELLRDAPIASSPASVVIVNSMLSQITAHVGMRKANQSKILLISHIEFRVR